jgi:hypothetical protein
MNQPKSHMRPLYTVSVIALVLLCGCAATKQARTVEKLGFLKDLYPVMTKGDESAGESLLVYKNPKGPYSGQLVYENLAGSCVDLPRSGIKDARDLTESSATPGRHVLCVDLPGAVQRLRDGR